MACCLFLSRELYIKAARWFSGTKVVEKCVVWCGDVCVCVRVHEADGKNRMYPL
jgi:hypothetical protein